MERKSNPFDFGHAFALAGLGCALRSTTTKRWTKITPSTQVKNNLSVAYGANVVALCWRCQRHAWPNGHSVCIGLVGRFGWRSIGDFDLA
jgi:hypothetical protein